MVIPRGVSSSFLDASPSNENHFLTFALLINLAMATLIYLQGCANPQFTYAHYMRIFVSYRYGGYIRIPLPVYRQTITLPLTQYN